MRTHAIYPGSFDPITVGHLDLIARAALIFSDLTVAVAHHTTGKHTLFSTEERVDLVRRVTTGLDNVTVEPFEGLLVEYAHARAGSVLVRGIRAYSDFEYEFQMALMNRKMSPDIETVFLMPKEEYSYVSSTLIREVAKLGGDVTPFVPPEVAERITERLADTKRENH